MPCNPSGWAFKPYKNEDVDGECSLALIRKAAEKARAGCEAETPFYNLGVGEKISKNGWAIEMRDFLITKEITYFSYLIWYP